MYTRRIAAMLLVVGTSGVAIAGQAGQATQPSQPSQQPSQQTTTRPETSQQATTTLTGCVYEERDVPGRSPNVAERAGILEDYILVASAAGATGSAGSSSTPGAAATAGTQGAGSMYKLELVDDSKLKAVVGKRVEVTGRIDRESGDSRAPAASTPSTTQTDRVIGRDRVDLPEFEVVSIKEVSGTCAAKPSAP